MSRHVKFEGKEWVNPMYGRPARPYRMDDEEVERSWSVNSAKRRKQRRQQARRRNISSKSLMFISVIMLQIAILACVSVTLWKVQDSSAATGQTEGQTWCKDQPCQNSGVCVEATDGRYCVCKGGWEGDSCEADIDECEEEDICGPQSLGCINTIGSYNCTCQFGFTSNGTGCVDIDECLTSPCHEFADCINLSGNYTCTCRPGYTGDGLDSCQVLLCENQEDGWFVSSSISDGSWSGLTNDCAQPDNYPFPTSSCGVDVSDCGTGYEISANMQAAQADLPDPEATTELVAQQETQLQRRGKDVENSSQNRTESEAKSCDKYIHPHAVLHDHNRTHDEQGDVFDVQPQAGTNDEDEGHYENQNVDSFQSICGQPSISSDTASSVKEMRGRGRRFNDAVDKGDELLPNPMHSGNALIPNPMYSGNALIPNPMYSGNVLIPNPMYSGNALIPNPMYSGNALRPNPMYVPNVPQPRANGGQRNSCAMVPFVAVAGLLIFAIALIITKFIPKKQDSFMPTVSSYSSLPTASSYSFTPTTWPNPTFPSQTDGTRHVGTFTISQTDGTRDVDYTSPEPTSTEEKHDKKVEHTTIISGGKGYEASMLNGQIGIVVSPSNEVFVTNRDNRGWVRVTNMSGVHLRNFPTIASENACKTTVLDGISFDGNGPLWAIDHEDCYPSALGLFVRYTKTGHQITTNHTAIPSNNFFGIAMDVLHNHQVSTQSWPEDDYSVVKILDYSDTLVRMFKIEHGLGYAGLVTVGRGGNPFVTDYWALHLYAYNETGHHLLSFGEGESLSEIMVMCTDTMIKCLFPHY
ncbi:UMOD [Branchiostoma lanceolatum]|uniref:UMOD protein n=1 Tax=Branchiostoma lanceolatum TaxID=7740 RepID=A0A8J9Z9I3_BRALA|nr:UMOD [Branchiostoma lanceolatum]